MEAVPGDRHSPDCFDPRRFGAWLAVERDEDGREHVVIAQGWRRIRIEVESGSIADGRPVVLHYRLAGVASAAPKVLPLRRLIELCRTGRFAGPLFPPDRRVPRWLLALRVHDALEAGASQREIAAVLFGEARVGREWRGGSESLRQQIRRLAGDARYLATGGYRSLLAMPDRR